MLIPTARAVQLQRTFLRSSNNVERLQSEHHEGGRKFIAKQPKLQSPVLALDIKGRFSSSTHMHGIVLLE